MRAKRYTDTVLGCTESAVSTCDVTQCDDLHSLTNKDQETMASIYEVNFVWTEYLDLSEYGDFDYSCWE